MDDARRIPPQPASARATRGGFPGLAAHDVQQLGSGQALVFDDALGDDVARALRLALTRRADELAPAAVGRGVDRLHEGALRGDRTAWLERSADEPLASLWALFERVARDLSEQAFLGVHDIEVQLALYPADGARYVAHRDAFAAGGRRRATAVYYLNPGWCAEHGGALRVRTPEGGTRDIEPLLDRLVVYLAERVEHEVLPTHAPRWAVTAWLLGPLSSA